MGTQKKKAEDKEDVVQPFGQDVGKTDFNVLQETGHEISLRQAFKTDRRTSFPPLDPPSVDHFSFGIHQAQHVISKNFAHLPIQIL